MEYTFSELKKLGKQDASALRQYRLAVLGDCSTQHVSAAIKGYAYTVGIGMNVFDADYDQIDAQIMDDTSELYGFKPDAVLLYMAAEKLYAAYCKTPLSERERFAERTMEHIFALWSKLAASCGASVLQFNFVRMDDACFGSFAGKVAASFLYQLDKLNLLLADGCRNTRAFSSSISAACRTGSAAPRRMTKSFIISPNFRFP